MMAEDQCEAESVRRFGGLRCGKGGEALYPALSAKQNSHRVGLLFVSR